MPLAREWKPHYIAGTSFTFHQQHSGGHMAIKTSTLDSGIGLIEASGSLVGGEETDKLRQAVAGFADREYAKLIIDLSNVTYLNSTAIGVLVSAHTSYARRNWQIKLCGINKNINNIFVITKLTLVFDVHDTREGAMKSFK
jgi:anti-sigma B factor antagonist